MITYHKKLIPTNRFAVAVSGGVDSLASALLLKRRGHDFAVFHFQNNYLTCDIEAERKITKFCLDNKLALFIERVKFAYVKGSVEAWCRYERYAAFNRLCERTGIKNIVVCHNLDDCCQSYLMRCLEGNPEYAPIPVITKYDNYTISRPFLLSPKTEFARYLGKMKGGEYLTEDTMNNNLSLKRNWVREVARPLLEQRFPGLAKIVKKRVDKFVRAASL